MERWETFHRKTQVSSCESGAARIAATSNASSQVAKASFQGNCLSSHQAASVSGSSSLVSINSEPQYSESGPSDSELSEDSEETGVHTSEEQKSSHSYSVKVINPLGKGGYEILSLESHVVYVEVADIKKDILSGCKEYLEADKDVQFGYVVPGHGTKGKQIAILLDSDLQEMYRRYEKKTDILLWMKLSRKRPRAEVSNTSSMGPGRKASRSNYDTQAQRMAEIDEICEKLVKKHGEKYTKEQTRAWAVLIQMGRHDSYDSPPDKHFFTVNKKKAGASTSAASGMPGPGVSPGKRLNMRSECIDQLEKWHRLMQNGAITPEQYEEIQDNILSDIKKV